VYVQFACKGRPQNDLCFVGWDVKPYSFIHSFLHRPSYSQFCPKFRCHDSGGWWAKMRLAALIGPSPKTPIGTKFCKNLLHKSSYSQFCPKFRRRGNGCRSGKLLLFSSTLKHSQCDAGNINITFCNFCCFRCASPLMLPLTSV